MKDFLANPVNEGDLVASTASGYADLHVWKVVKVTPKTVVLERDDIYQTRDTNTGELVTRTSKKRVRRSSGEFVVIVFTER